MSAPISRAEFLKAQDRYATAISASAESRWGEDAVDTTQTSPLHLESDAAAEAGRQLAHLAQVRVRDVVEVAGVHTDLEGATVRLPYAGRLGMGATADMLVVKARIDRNAGVTILTGEVILP